MVAPVRKITAPKIYSDVVLWEEELAYSREAPGPVKATTVTDIGTPLAEDEDGKIVPLPSDGSLACWGVSLSIRAASAADTSGDLLAIRRTAILKDSGIVWPAGITDAHKAVAVAALDARGIIIRAAI